MSTINLTVVNNHFWGEIGMSGLGQLMGSGGVSIWGGEGVSGGNGMLSIGGRLCVQHHNAIISGHCVS